MLPVRSIAVRAAVVGFFVVSIVGSIGGLTPFVCCRRALVGAAVAYVAAGGVARAINAILTHAMINSQMHKEYPGDGTDRARL